VQEAAPRRPGDGAAVGAQHVGHSELRPALSKVAKGRAANAPAARAVARRGVAGNRRWQARGSAACGHGRGCALLGRRAILARAAGNWTCRAEARLVRAQAERSRRTDHLAFAMEARWAILVVEALALLAGAGADVGARPSRRRVAIGRLLAAQLGSTELVQAALAARGATTRGVRHATAGRVAVESLRASAGRPTCLRLADAIAERNARHAGLGVAARRGLAITRLGRAHLSCVAIRSRSARALVRHAAHAAIGGHRAVRTCDAAERRALLASRPTLTVGNASAAAIRIAGLGVRALRAFRHRARREWTDDVLARILALPVERNRAIGAYADGRQGTTVRIRAWAGPAPFAVARGAGITLTLHVAGATDAVATNASRTDGVAGLGCAAGGLEALVEKSTDLVGCAIGVCFAVAQRSRCRHAAPANGEVGFIDEALRTDGCALAIATFGPLSTGVRVVAGNRRRTGGEQAHNRAAVRRIALGHGAGRAARHRAVGAGDLGTVVLRPATVAAVAGLATADEARPAGDRRADRVGALRVALVEDDMSVAGRADAAGRAVRERLRNAAIRSGGLTARVNDGAAQIGAHDAIGLGNRHHRAFDARLAFGARVTAAVVHRGAARILTVLADLTGGIVDGSHQDGAARRVGQLLADVARVTRLKSAVRACLQTHRGRAQRALCLRRGGLLASGETQ
jgi:hypothetical protein